MKVLIQVRHRMKPVPARITIEEDHSYAFLHSKKRQSLISRVVARLDDPITGVSPGQILAVYMGDECLGSAKIRDTVTLGDLDYDGTQAVSSRTCPSSEYI